MMEVSFAGVLVQIALLDIVLSLDSLVTEVGMVDPLWAMITAVVLSIGFMHLFAGAISGFVDRHSTTKLLARSFLILIGVTWIAEGLDHPIPKGWIYFSLAFSGFVECLNLRMGSPKTPPVKLYEAYVDPHESGGRATGRERCARADVEAPSAPGPSGSSPARKWSTPVEPPVRSGLVDTIRGG